MTDASPPYARIWVVPHNDGEAVEIGRLLAENGETVLQTAQPWGASWAHLEPAIRDHLWNAAPGTFVYGIELAGPDPFGAINIDHHRYRDSDRANSLSSLEQVAQILGIRLNRWRELVAANDKAWIPGMLALGATPQEIEVVRQQDRIAQGLGEMMSCALLSRAEASGGFGAPSEQRAAHRRGATSGGPR